MSKLLMAMAGGWLVYLSSITVPLAQAESPRRSFIAADSSKKQLALIDEQGKTQWQVKIGPLHDFHLLPSGNVLLQTSWTHVAEIEPTTNKTVWQYDSATSNGNAGSKVEVHAFQRLASGITMIAESGPGRIIEVDQQGNLVRQIRLKVDKPHPHRDTRLARKLSSGHYLVCHEGDGAVREYDSSGAVVWEYRVPLFDKLPAGGHGVDAWGNQCFSAVRLPNGNTLISTGNGHSIIEVNRDKKIVWQLNQHDLPNVQLAWVTTVQVLRNGNIVLGNCHAGKNNPQIIEITRDKQIVWSFFDWERFGDSLTNSLVVTVDGQSVASKVDAHITRAGTNASQIRQAWEQLDDRQRAGLDYLLTHMPQSDIEALSAEFLVEHVRGAYRAWDEAPWKAQVPTEVFLDAVLPYANIDEQRDRWRDDFRQRFQPLIAGVDSPSVAAARLNQKIFPLLNVKYSTRRARANQGPYESIKSGLASCTGLSILLIDACRSVGIPARFVGTPLWTDGSGNHSWVEIWSNGDWHFTGAAEPNGDDLDKSWFVNRASAAKIDQPRNAIYAVSFRSTPTPFPMVWSRGKREISAVNVTSRYTRRATEVPTGQIRVRLKVVDGTSNQRVALPVAIDFEGTRADLGKSRDEGFDNNDHLEIMVAKNQMLTLWIDESKLSLTPQENDQIFVITVRDGVPAVQNR